MTSLRRVLNRDGNGCSELDIQKRLGEGKGKPTHVTGLYRTVEASQGSGTKQMASDTFRLRGIGFRMAAW
jgi:hypothetical protein